MYSLLKRHTTLFRTTVHSFWRNNIWQVLEICADSWIFLSFVLFGSGAVMMLFPFFFSLNPDVLTGPLWQCLGLFCLRCVQRVKLLSETLGLLQKVPEVPVLQRSPSPRIPRGCCSLGAPGSFLAPSLRRRAPLPSRCRLRPARRARHLPRCAAGTRHRGLPGPRSTARRGTASPAAPPAAFVRSAHAGESLGKRGALPSPEFWGLLHQVVLFWQTRSQTYIYRKKLNATNSCFAAFRKN